MAHDGPFSIVLADGHLGYRAGVERAIAAHQELALAGVAGDGIEALRLIESCSPDVALVDVRLPGPGGLVISRDLMDIAPRLATRVVISNTLLDRPLGFMHKALSAGAAGCLGKDASREQICEALVAAARCQTWISLDPAVGMVFPEASGPPVRVQ